MKAARFMVTHCLAGDVYITEKVAARTSPGSMVFSPVKHAICSRQLKTLP